MESRGRKLTREDEVLEGILGFQLFPPALPLHLLAVKRQVTSSAILPHHIVLWCHRSKVTWPSDNVLKFPPLTVAPNESFLFVNWLSGGLHCSCKAVTHRWKWQGVAEDTGHSNTGLGRWVSISYGSVLGPHWEVSVLSSHRHSRSWLIIWVCRWHPSDRGQQWGLGDQRHERARFLHEDKPTGDCHFRLHLASQSNNGFCSKDLGLRSAGAQVCCERFGRAVGVSTSQLWGY